MEPQKVHPICFSSPAPSASRFGTRCRVEERLKLLSVQADVSAVTIGPMGTAAVVTASVTKRNRNRIGQRHAAGRDIGRDHGLAVGVGPGGIIRAHGTG